MHNSTKKSSLFERLRQGLEDGIKQLRGEMAMRTTVLEKPAAPPHYSAGDVQRIRERSQMSQGLFARFLNVSVKTVQSWEQGLRSPSQAALRLLQFVNESPEFAYQIALGREDEESEARRKRSRARQRAAKQPRAVAMADRPKSPARTVRKIKP